MPGILLVVINKSESPVAPWFLSVHIICYFSVAAAHSISSFILR